MTYRKELSQYVANFVDALVQSGLTDVVISPGSRSTPLAMTMCEHEAIKDWVIIDERSAAFFALGMAQQTNRPVALVCTSGTAATNYFPAIAEAYHNRIPLLVFTTDRPHELRDVGAPQAIDQIKMYGDYVKWFKEMLIPEGNARVIHDVRRTALLAMTIATSDNPGPVHLNFPFREPLIPEFSSTDRQNYLQTKQTTISDEPFAIGGEKRLNDDQLQSLIRHFQGKKRGLIIVGPQRDPNLARAVSELAAAWNIPVLADPLSQLRAGSHSKEQMIMMYDAFLRRETIREQLKPDFIIRIGAMPVSKMLLFYLEQHQDITQIVVENFSGYRQPTEKLANIVYADGTHLCADLVKQTRLTDISSESSWLNEWQTYETIAENHLFSKPEKQLTEAEAVRGLLEIIPDESSIYIGNSMAVRDLDMFFKATEKRISILDNRGVNGIDGVVSSGLGAAAYGKRMTLVLGDLSFYHDLNGLLAAKHYNLDLTILLINNDGGGIFSFLPQANHPDSFEKLFGTPLGIDFSHVVNMYGGNFTEATSYTDLQNKLKLSYEQKGLSVIEVVTDREENVQWHRHKWGLIEKDLLKME